MEQNRTEQNKTEQSNTEQNRTEQDNTRSFGCHTFKLPASTKHILWLTRQILFLTISVYDYYDIGSSSVVYRFHKISNL